jgi:hypothetical protein
MRIRNVVSWYVNFSKGFIEKSIKLPPGPDPDLHKKAESGSGSASSKKSNQDLHLHRQKIKIRIQICIQIPSNKNQNTDLHQNDKSDVDAHPDLHHSDVDLQNWIQQTFKRKLHHLIIIIHSLLSTCKNKHLMIGVGFLGPPHFCIYYCLREKVAQDRAQRKVLNKCTLLLID